VKENLTYEFCSVGCQRGYEEKQLREAQKAAQKAQPRDLTKGEKILEKMRFLNAES
jgi:hypothetical protein